MMHPGVSRLMLICCILLWKCHVTNSQTIHIGYISNEFNHGAISIGLEKAQNEGHFIGYNFRFVNILFNKDCLKIKMISRILQGISVC